MNKKHLLGISEISKKDIEEIFETADRLKSLSLSDLPLAKKTIALFFEKPSLRTRVSFFVASYQLGGNAIELTPDQIKPGGRETLEDIARNLSLWVDVLVARTFKHFTIQRLAKNSSIPVINALYDIEHPCQALADFYTIRKYLLNTKKNWNDIKLAFVGDGNNVCHSLMLTAALLGTKMSVVGPAKFRPLKRILSKCSKLNQTFEMTMTEDIGAGVKDADFIYTDVWASMGQENERDIRIPFFKKYQVNRNLFSIANPDAKFMHCLPAHRGEEVTDDVLDGKSSVALEQAENRLHIQKSLLYLLAGGKK